MSAAEIQLQPVDPVDGDLTDLVADLGAALADDGDPSQSIAERAAEWGLELTGEGLPEELAYNAYLPTFIEAQDAIATLKAQHEAARAELAEARSALDAAGQRLALDPSPSEADVIGREALKVAQAESRIRAYETVVIPGAEARLKEADTQRAYLRQVADVARAERELAKFVYYIPLWENQLRLVSQTLETLREIERRFHDHLREHQIPSLLNPAMYASKDLIPGGVLASAASRELWRLFKDNNPPTSDIRNPRRPLDEIARARTQVFMPVQLSPEALRRVAELEAEERSAGQ